MQRTLHTRHVLRFTLISSLLFAVSACGPSGEPQSAHSAQSPAQKPEYPGTLRPPSLLAENFQWRQQITATWETGSRSFDAVLSKDGNTMRLIGLSPMGMPGFVITLEGTTISVENHSGQEMPFPPRYVLLDVQRAFFPWFSEVTPSSGVRNSVFDGEAVQETWQAGSLQQRSFRRIDNKPPGEIVVRYRGWSAGQAAPSETELVNGWYGYTLQIRTLEQTRLQ